MVVQILFWVLLILWAILGPWAPWGERTPAWSGHLVQVVLFVCLGLTVYGMGVFR